MRAVELIEPSLTALRAALLPDPAPGPGEALLRLRAASLNFLDIAVATGTYPVPAFPLVPVADGAGEVVEVGPGVEGVRAGERVVPHFLPGWQGGPITPEAVALMRGVNQPGSLAEYVAVPAAALVRTPAHLSDEAAATLPIAGATAWAALRAAGVGPHSTVVVLGTGGVSVMALQLAKASGAQVIVTSSSDAKLERAVALGADHGVNYRAAPDWDRAVLEITGGRGADLILETGGAETLARSVNAAAHGGMVFIIGFLSGLRPTIELLPVIGKAVTLQGATVGSVADLREAARAIDLARLHPVVDRVFGMEEAGDAYAHVAAGGRHFGKVAIRI